MKNGGPTLREAAQHILDCLTDDHEDCNICGQSREQGHDPDCACGELQNALGR